jgi:hypothetical protein
MSDSSASPDFVRLNWGDYDGCCQEVLALFSTRPLMETSPRWQRYRPPLRGLVSHERARRYRRMVQ